MALGILKVDRISHDFQHYGCLGDLYKRSTLNTVNVRVTRESVLKDLIGPYWAQH